MCTEDKQYVYAMINGAGLYKLGKSKHPHKRVKQLHTGDPSIILSMYREVPDMARAERALHTIFNARRKDKEWFELNEEEQKLLNNIFTGSGLSENEERVVRFFGLWT